MKITKTTMMIWTFLIAASFSSAMAEDPCTDCKTSCNQYTDTGDQNTCQTNCTNGVCYDQFPPD